jgi:hypothetical protein
MVMFAKRKPEPTPERKPEPAPDLGGEILRLRGQIENFIDGKVAELKASRDGQSLPVGDLRHMLTQGDSCLCRAATRLLNE